MITTDWFIIGLLLLFVLCVLAALFGPTKGQIGEDQIHKSLERLEGQKAILQNCYLPQKDSGTTEVDLILIHESGIYVIESKNYSGWIFGKENQRYWMQSLRGHNGIAEKHQFYNPIWQNKTHIGCLKNLLQDRTIPIHSYVVFGNNCTLKDIDLTDNDCQVVYERQLVQKISENATIWRTCLSDEKIAALYSLLLNFTDATAKQKETHITEVHAKLNPVVQPDGTLNCPRCGGKLVLRVAKQGKRAGQTFWGCSNYPKCHFTYQK